MNWLEALILGIVQGLTEFLPVSSSGHLELSKALLGVEFPENVLFTVVVHGATVLSTIVVFWKDIIELLRGLFEFRWNKETKYVAMIIFSMIPVGIVGVFLKDHIEALFDSPYIVVIVGFMLLVTAALLAFSSYKRHGNKEVTFKRAFVIGLAQAFAIIPGISRSGSTIAIGLLLGVKSKRIAKFSFLMVLAPILGENVLDLASFDYSSDVGSEILPLLAIGFIAAFVSGLLACKWMIKIVKKGNLTYFAIYCLIIGVISIVSYMYTDL